MTQTSQVMYKNYKEMDNQWSNNYGRRGELQSQYPKYNATGSSSISRVPAAKGTMSIRSWS
jgi:hypothetical protein